MEAKWIFFICLAVVLVGALVGLCLYRYKHPDSISVRFMSRVAMFGAMATLLYVVPTFSIALPFFPAFLKIHVDEIPSFIAGFAFGPLTGVATVFIKTIIKLPLTETMCVGELSDFLLSATYIGLASLIFNKSRNFKGAALGIGIATVVQLLLAMVLNVYMLIPFYVSVMGWSEEMILGMMQKAVPAISNVGWSYALLAVLPFNAMKDAIVIAVTLIAYRFLRKIVEKEANNRPSKPVKKVEASPTDDQAK